ncbi:MAG: hypothetical protein H6565_04530 [Lewinellaceae bacterium]|nr:hypothetical protein [Lewinellaceae bacterium]MCB9355744.1 hypothetical protein [Lewinellaceae bacterium]
MKRLVTPILLFSLLFSACQKIKKVESSPDGPWLRGTADWLLNGEGPPWPPASLALRTDKNIAQGTFSLDLSVILYGLYLAQGLYFNDIPLEEGEYPLFDNITSHDGVTGAYFSFLDVDVLLKSYRVIGQDSTNFISVDMYDVDKGEIYGRFSIALAQQQASPSTYPDTIFLRNGWYRAVLNYR